MTPCDEFFNALFVISPMFVHPARDVLFIQSPSKFHSTILDLIRLSREKLVISSLYIGCSHTKGDDLSREVVDALREKLTTIENENFTLKVLVDGMRSTRTQDNSIMVLEQLKHDFPNHQVEIHPMVVANPFFSKTLGKLLGNFEATSRLQHMKYIILDDDVLVTGANLSGEYFTTRKDRYVLIKNSPSLASFYSDLTSLLIMATSRQPPPRSKVKDKLLDLLRPRTFSFENKPVFNQSNDKVYLFPSLQIPWLEIQHEETLITTLLGMARKMDVKIHFSTAYFNLAPIIQKYFFEGSPVSSPNPTVHETKKLDHDLSSFSSIVTSAPACNSFFRAKWPKRMIPSVYENLLQQFASTLREKNITNLRLFQYRRPKWTYHAKGLFLAHNDAIFLTQIGSSNYGTLFFTTIRATFLCCGL